MQAHNTPTRLDARRGVAREPHTCLQCGEQFIPKRQTRACSARGPVTGNGGRSTAPKRSPVRAAKLWSV